MWPKIWYSTSMLGSWNSFWAGLSTFDGVMVGSMGFNGISPGDSWDTLRQSNMASKLEVCFAGDISYSFGFSIATFDHLDYWMAIIKSQWILYPMIPMISKLSYMDPYPNNIPMFSQHPIMLRMRDGGFWNHPTEGIDISRDTEPTIWQMDAGFLWARCKNNVYTIYNQQCAIDNLNGY